MTREMAAHAHKKDCCCCKCGGGTPAVVYGPGPVFGDKTHAGTTPMHGGNSPSPVGGGTNGGQSAGGPAGPAGPSAAGGPSAPSSAGPSVRVLHIGGSCRSRQPLRALRTCGDLSSSRFVRFGDYRGARSDGGRSSRCRRCVVGPRARPGSAAFLPSRRHPIFCPACKRCPEWVAGAEAGETSSAICWALSEASELCLESNAIRTSTAHL